MGLCAFPIWITFPAINPHSGYQTAYPVIQQIGGRPVPLLYTKKGGIATAQTRKEIQQAYISLGIS